LGANLALFFDISKKNAEFLDYNPKIRLIFWITIQNFRYFSHFALLCHYRVFLCHKNGRKYLRGWE